VGTGKTITVSGVTLGGTDAGNYNLLQQTGLTADITKASATVTANSATVTYNGSSQSVSGFTVVGLLGNEIAATALSGVTASGATATNAGTYSNSLSGSATNYNLTFVNGSLTISPATLTLTGTQAYNGTAVIYGAGLTAHGVNNESFTVSGSADLTSKHVQANQALANVNGLTLTPVGSALLSNYSPLTVSNTSISVTPLPITLTAPTINKVYDGGYTYTVTSANLAALSAQLVGGDTVTAASVAFAGNNPNVGSNKTVNLLSATISDGNNGANYNVSLASTSNSQITPAPLIVKAVNSAKFVTQTDPSNYGGVIYTGFVNGETSSVLSGTLSIARSDSGNNSAGNYTLTPSGYGSANSTNGNYQISYQTGNFIIVPAQNLLVTVSANTSTYGTTPTYTFTAQYLASNSSTITYLGRTGTSPSTTAINLTTSGSTPITVNDGVGSTATFTITPASAATSGSGNVVVGAYNLSAANTQTTGNNFLGFTLVGSLTVNPLTLAANELGISGVNKVYNGNNSITGLTLNVSPLLSRVISGDNVNVLGTGTFDNANVGTSKAITLNVALSGADSGNYVLSNNQLNNNSGSITQLASVTYVGANGGNWSNASNWAGGAIPTLSNVAQVIIPVGSTVSYDNAAMSGLLPTSTITNNGTIAFNGSNNFEFTNIVSGTGSISQSGAGVLTLSSANTNTGDTFLNSGTLVVNHANALATRIIAANGGALKVANGITLADLTVNGSVIIDSDINTVGAQTYNGPVTISGGNAINNVVTPLALSTNNANITFNSTLGAGSNSLSNKRSLVLNAGTGQVTFGDRVGAINTTYGAYLNRTTDVSLYDLTVNAGTILIKGDITTFNTQTYNGDVLIGDNGTNGLVRTLLSQDPTVTFNGKIDDAVANTHTLVIKAITLTGNEVPSITFAQDIGSRAALANLVVTTGIQNPDHSSLLSDISLNSNDFVGQINIAGNVTTSGNQIYTADTYSLGVAGNTSANTQVFTSSNGGDVTFNVGTDPTPFTLVGAGSVGFNLSGGTVNAAGISAMNASGITTLTQYTAPIAPPSEPLVVLTAPPVMKANDLRENSSYSNVVGSVDVGDLEDGGAAPKCDEPVNGKLDDKCSIKL
jgi:autotransporter-associated beta strand protein